ncbi:hypothetical protein [Rhodoblastus sp.]|jgi:hypothetical protein|uniref:hypothetical protein n=1 Tax=Rhodoblastus sp. TaxID=1962975 RepID=UPI0025D514A3|nr:hypothetical protein [Rhodoblastus sp.]
MSTVPPPESSSSAADAQVAEVALARLVRALARQAAREEFNGRSEGDAVLSDREPPPAESRPQFNSEAVDE